MTLKQLEDMWTDALEKKTGGEFIKAVRSAAQKKSIISQQLVGKLESYANELLPGEQIAGRGYEHLEQADKWRITLYGQLLAAAMILQLATNSSKGLRKNMLKFLEVSSFVVKSNYDFIGKAIDALEFNFKELGYDWNAVETASSLDVLAYKVCSESVMGTARNNFVFNGAGQACILDGVLQIKSSAGETASTKAFGADQDRVQVFTRNTRDEKLKTSDVEDAAEIEAFARTFAQTQTETLKSALHPQGYKLNVGDKVTIKCLYRGTDEEDRPIIKCAALDSPDMAEGRILDEELIRGTYTEDLIDYFYDDDCIENAIVVEAGENPVFSIKDAYAKFSRGKAEADVKKNTVFEAKAVQIVDDIKRINWMTAGGYGGISLLIDGVDEGDIKPLSISSIQSRTGDLFINVCPPKYDSDSPVVKFDEESVLSDFIVNVKTALENIRKKDIGTKDSQPDEQVWIMSLSRILSRKTSERDSMETYRRLLCSEFLSRLSGDAEGEKIYGAQASYLGKCIEYAQTGALSRSSKPDGLSEEQNRVLDILSNAGNPENVSLFASMFTPGGLSDVTNSILSLLISLSTSRKYRDEISATPDKVRKAICKILGVSDRFRASEAIVWGKYGKGENQKLEFKASYVNRNDGKGPDLDYQGRGQVFEAVCGFLNSDGGTVYIGVDDKTGDPIISEDYGIKGDIRWLTENYAKVNERGIKLLGHPVPKADSLDHFILFLNAEKESYFSPSLQKNITIEATEDQDAIRITVSQSLYEIAFLYKSGLDREGGIAYMRDGNSTVPMSDRDMEQRLMSLKSIRKEMGFIVKLKKAIDRKHKVILKGYASGNSGTIRDRFVVPINLFYNDENVYCWDLEENDFKQFRLSRIGEVETDIDDPVYTHAYEPREADVFRWINENESYHVKVRMEVGARNYLLEEYSNAKNLPEQELYEDEDGKWILDTRLQGLGAMRRFFLGLADKIEILPTEDSEKLKSDIREYVKGNLKEYIG